MDFINLAILSECCKICKFSFVYLTSAFSYEEGALVPEASCEKTQEGGKLQHSKRASREYIPSAKVGSRLPHMLIRGLPASSEVCPLDT
jgi:hypothetical protein